MMNFESELWAVRIPWVGGGRVWLTPLNPMIGKALRTLGIAERLVFATVKQVGHLAADEEVHTPLQNSELL